MATHTIDFNELPYLRDFDIHPGDAIEWPLTLQVNSTATNLTGCTVSYSVVNAAGTSVIAATTITPDSAAAGQFTFRITAAQTAAWDGAYTYQVKVVWPLAHSNFAQGATRIVAEGTISVAA